MIQVASDDTGCQNKGIVGIIYCVVDEITGDARQQTFDRNLLMQVGAFIRFGAPIRVMGLHFAYNVKTFQNISGFITALLSQTVRRLFTTHFGELSDFNGNVGILWHLSAPSFN